MLCILDTRLFDLLLLADTAFDQNSARDGNGGGVAVWQSNPDFHISNCSFSHCSASSANGGSIILFNDNQNAVMEDIEVNYSTAINGGALYLGTENTHFSLSNAAFVYCEASEQGGSVYLYQSNENAKFADVVFDNSVAGGEGGGISVFEMNKNVSMTKVRFYSCSASYGGGLALSSFNDNFRLASAEFLSCDADNGGSFSLGSANNQTVIEDVTFKSSYAYGWGGSLFVNEHNVDLLILYCVFDDSSASESGGAMDLTVGNDNITLVDVSFVDVSSGAPGGAISLYPDNEGFSCTGCSFENIDGYFAVDISQSCHHPVFIDCSFDSVPGAISIANSVDGVEIQNSNFLRSFGNPAVFFHSLSSNILIQNCAFAFNSNANGWENTNGGAIRFGDSNTLIVIRNVSTWHFISLHTRGSYPVLK